MTNTNHDKPVYLRFGGRMIPLLILSAQLCLSVEQSTARETLPPVSDPAGICDQVSLLAAARTGVPLSVLKAISLSETGRNRGGVTRPWPWTVNMEGSGRWFDSREAALAYVNTHHTQGARSFDVGCFQINYKWHHQAFASIEEMMDPVSNALYAAKFLNQLFAEKGNWNDAAGAYHSRTPEFANRYKQRFARHRARLMDEDTPGRHATGASESPGSNPLAALVTPPRAVRIRVNTFPLLLQSGHSAAALGSLVPLGNPSAAQSLFVAATPLDG